MDLKKLLTLTFDKNVGAADRVFRLLSGLALLAAGLILGWISAVPGWAAAAISVAGIMWVATGALSRCSIYYLIGYSSCPSDRDGAR